VVISDTSAWDVGFLGQAGHVPGWPGEDAYPPQPMVSQTAELLERCGDVRVERFEGSGHFPPIDAAGRWSEVFFGFVEDAER
jgi:pimeloyl-ACP methyl ester carboxylesterase